MESYELKYLKYKNKYLELKDQLGGSDSMNTASNELAAGADDQGGSVSSGTPNPHKVDFLPCLAKVAEYVGMNSPYTIIVSGEGGASSGKDGFIKQKFKNGDYMFSNQKTEKNYYVNEIGYSVINSKLAKVTINEDKKIVKISEI